MTDKVTMKHKQKAFKINTFNRKITLNILLSYNWSKIAKNETQVIKYNLKCGTKSVAFHLRALLYFCFWKNGNNKTQLEVHVVKITN